MEEVRANVAAREAAEREARRAADEARAKRAAEVEAQRTEQAMEWVKGERDHAPHTSLPYVRVKGDTLETSYGAKVPLTAALGVFRLAERCAERATAFTPDETIKLGDFRLDHISPEGTIRAGCHLIPLDRARMAASLAGLA